MAHLLYNGKVLTPEGIHTWLIFEKNVILSTGDGEPPDAEDRTDLQGNLILPGLHDSHIHVYSLGRMSTRLSLYGAGSITELQSRLEEFYPTTPQPWVIGHGWDQDLMEDRRYPTRHDLDVIVADRPVLLYRACNHIGVVNSKALALMGIDASTSDPEGGKIDREPDGTPTGILREEGLSLVSPFVTPLDDEFRMQYYREGLRICLEKGLTAVHTNDAQAWQHYKQLADTGELPIRVFLTLKFSDFDRDEYIPSFGEATGWLTCRRVKLFSDGSLGAETAALREPYSGEDQRGILIDSPDILAEKIRTIHDRGYQLEVHAIGDRAAEVTMDGFDKAGILANDRPIITHCQILGDDLVERMSKNGYIANIQPPFVPTDARWAEKRLGQGERLDFSYAWKTLVDRGVICTGGSDAPIEDPDPFWGIYCALTHPGPDGRTWKASQRLPWEDAIDIYSKNAAFAVGREHDLGQLKPGYKADFVIADPDILEDHEKLKDHPLREVWIGGKRQFSL